MSNKRTAGYTLIELMVVLLIFGIVMTLISVTFARIVRSSSHLSNAGETDIGGLIGLELMRSDLELAGYGLYWKLPVGAEDRIAYTETRSDLVTVHRCLDGCPGAKPSCFDDSTYDSDRYIPRAYRVGNNVGYNGSDYLVLKGTAVGIGKVCRSWGYVNNLGSVSLPPQGDEEQRFKKGDGVVVIRSGVINNTQVRELVMHDGDFCLSFDDPLPSSFRPKDSVDSYLVYGVDDKGGLAFPFNRADYYISRPEDISSTCAPGTGVLYKSAITQERWHALYPILDCVADMQVLLYWDTNGDGIIDYRGDDLAVDDKAEIVEAVASNAAEFREKLKEVRVYILAQQGRKDLSYSYPVTDPDKAVAVGDGVLGRFWNATQMTATFGADWRNYHWKLYTIVVQPKNM